MNTTSKPLAHACGRRYDVIDCRTKCTVGNFSTLRRARNFADQKDAEYGAVRYIVRLSTK